MNISIIGAGNMARGIGTRFVAGGNSVTVAGKDQVKATALAKELRARQARRRSRCRHDRSGACQ